MKVRFTLYSTILLTLTLFSQSIFSSDDKEKKEEKKSGSEAISPLDDRYKAKLTEISTLVSEAALIRYRIFVETQWLLFLNETLVEESPENELGLTAAIISYLENAAKAVDDQAVARVKALEKTTNHDVKAVEYYLREKLASVGANERTLAFIHFGLTSEDVNNAAYALMIKDLVNKHVLPTMELVQANLKAKARAYAALPMLGHTHGQAATPTTLGKEIAVFGYRLGRIQSKVAKLPLLAKWNGAIGCYNAHCVAFPEIQWPEVCKNFVEERLQVKFNRLTTQVENHDYIAELIHDISLYNTISIGMAQDMWTYIMKDYLKLKTVAGQVGSSTMPHKVNPIDFENAEGNFGMANGVGEFFARKIPISRMQRDLSGSTVMRNIGVFFAHHILAQKNLLAGLDKIDANGPKMLSELSIQWQILAEPLQMLLRKKGIVNSYERLKDLTRGEHIDKKCLQEFINRTPELDPKLLDTLKPETYLGEAETLALQYANGEIN